jgi:tetratricopeptide (TPR) repeat protein
MSFFRSALATRRHIFLGLVIGLGSLAALSQRARQRTVSGAALAHSYSERARKALAAGDNASAKELLEKATKADPKSAEAHFLLGLIEFKAGDTQNAIQHYERSLKLQPNSYSGHYNLALALLKEQKVHEARVELEKAVRMDRTQSDAAYDLGIVLLELHEPAAAVVHLRRAKALDPSRADAAFNVVRAELESGKPAEARTEAQSSAKRFGADFRWNAGIGQLFLKNAQPKEAAVYLRQADQLQPNDADVRHQLALAYLGAEEPEEALSAIGEGQTAEDHYLRASAYYMSHRFPQADRESQEALALAPENPQILILRTRLLQRAGEQDAALQTAKKAIELAPTWDEPYFLAGVSYYFIRRYEQAEQSLGRAAQLNPNEARALFLEAIAAANRGKIAEAEQTLRRAITIQPKNARFHCHLGILLTRKNEYEQGEAALRTAIRLKPEYALSHYELGKLLVYSKRLNEAAEELSQAVKYDPTLSAAYYQLARVYSKLGETAKSERVLADFERLYQKQASESESVDRALEEDTRKETELR